MKFPLGQARPEVRAEEAREEQGGELRPDPAAFQVAPVGHDAEEAHHEAHGLHLPTPGAQAGGARGAGWEHARDRLDRASGTCKVVLVIAKCSYRIRLQRFSVIRNFTLE